MSIQITRIDKYSIQVGEDRVRATPEQEAALRNMPDDAIERFVKIMTKG